jgi:hypothetical protein
MTDHFQAYIKNTDQLGQASRELFQVAKQVLTEDISSFKTQNFQIHESQNRHSPKRSSWRKPALAGSAVLTLAVLTQVWPELQLFFKSHDKNSIAQQMVEQRRIQSIYLPAQDGALRTNYTDNVLYNYRYVSVKTSPEYQKAWSLRLNDLDLIKQLALNEDKMIQYQAAQNALVKDLASLREKIDAMYLSEGLERLRKVEAEARTRMQNIVQNEATLKKLEALETEFLLSYFQAHPQTSR